MCEKIKLYKVLNALLTSRLYNALQNNDDILINKLMQQVCHVWTFSLLILYSFKNYTIILKNKNEHFFVNNVG